MKKKKLLPFLRYLLFSVMLLFAGKTSAQTNLALLNSTNVSTSYVSPWESLGSVNDGFTPINSEDRTNPVYGNWNGDASYNTYNWIEYDWDVAHEINSVALYWFTDFGGIAKPTNAYIEYWNGLAWVNGGAVGLALNQFNTLGNLNFTTKKIRVYFKSDTATGVLEFKVFGIEPTGQKTLFIPTEWSDPNNEFYNKTSSSRRYESTNFVLYWGDKVGTNPAAYSDPALRFTPKSVADTLETSFKRYITDLQFINNASTKNLGKYKIIIMMMNTWNSTDPRLEAFAQASSFSNTIGAMFVHPEATRDGGALSHEFAHTLQMMMQIQENPGNGNAFSGYDWASPFYEGHANFMRAQTYPQWAEIDGTLTRWIQTRQFMWSSNRHHYTNFHLMYYVQEKEGFDFTRRMWAESKNQEHPLETIKRLKGFTQDQLDDYLWGYAQRQPAFDYPIQWNSQINTASNFGKKIREVYNNIKNYMPRYTSRQYTLLTKVPGTTDQFYTNSDWAPQDYGMNIIPLYPTCSGNEKKVTIKFKGHTEVNTTQAGWRYGFATTKADGSISRYSPMYKTDGEASFSLKATEANIFLVVFSAPKVHVNYNMDEGYPKQRRYPYEVKIANATPEGFQPAANFRSFLKTNGHIHSNGGGWVSNTATVASSVYVGPYAIVLNGTLSGNARVDGFAMVDGGTINGNAIVRDNACVYNANLSSSAIVEGNAWMEGGSVANTAKIRGNAMLFAGNFGGSVVVGGDAEIGSCSTAGTYLQFPYWRNGRDECDGKGASDVSNVDINATFTNFSASSMAFSTTPTCTVTAKLSKNKATIDDSDSSLSIFPNPTVGTVTISFILPQQEMVTISLFDMNGRKLNDITDKTYDAGRVNIEYNCSNLISGIYLLRIQTGDIIDSKSFIKE